MEQVYIRLKVNWQGEFAGTVQPSGPNRARKLIAAGVAELVESKHDMGQQVSEVKKKRGKK